MEQWRQLDGLDQYPTLSNDNDNMLFDHNVQIEITINNSSENQIINWSEDY